MMNCEFCGYEFDETLGKYGCPNCHGEGLEQGNDMTDVNCKLHYESHEYEDNNQVHIFVTRGEEEYTIEREYEVTHFVDKAPDPGCWDSDWDHDGYTEIEIEPVSQRLMDSDGNEVTCSWTVEGVPWKEIEDAMEKSMLKQCLEEES